MATTWKIIPIWLPVTLQFRLDYEEGGANAVSADDISELLHWLKVGNRPRDPWVANAMLQRIGRFVRGANTRIYLSLFEAMPGRQDNLSVLNEIEDPEALPLPKYWASLPGAAEGRQQLQYNIDRLESRQKRVPAAAVANRAKRAWGGKWRRAPPLSKSQRRKKHIAG